MSYEETKNRATPEIVASISFTGEDEFDPQRLGAALGIAATKMWRKGEPRVAGKDRGFARQHSFWEFQLRDRSMDQVSQLERLLDFVEPLKHIIEEFVQDHSLSVQVSLHANVPSSGHAPVWDFTPQHLSRVSALGANFQLAMYLDD